MASRAWTLGSAMVATLCGAFAPYLTTLGGILLIACAVLLARPGSRRDHSAGVIASSRPWGSHPGAFEGHDFAAPSNFDVWW